MIASSPCQGHSLPHCLAQGCSHVVPPIYISRQTSLFKVALSIYPYTYHSTPGCIYIRNHRRTPSVTSTPRTIVEPAPCHIDSYGQGGTVQDWAYLMRLSNDRRLYYTPHYVCACVEQPTMPVHPTTCKPSCIWHPASRAKPNWACIVGRAVDSVQTLATSRGTPLLTGSPPGRALAQQRSRDEAMKIRTSMVRPLSNNKFSAACSAMQ